MSGRTESIAERRLRHVYDYLDSGNNKKAVQEADKVLKKHPDALLAKTLKSLALIRLSRKDEAWKLIEEVETESPLEEHTLQALTHCFKDLTRHDRIASLYEAVCAKAPTNEDFLTHLFMSYVRLRKYKKQQQAAMQIYKLKPHNPYYFWAVMSIVMQGLQNPALGASMFLPLAEKMVKKFQSEDKITAEAEVLLLLLILERQEKYSDALELVQSGLAEKLVRNMWDKQYKIIHYLEKLGQWKEIRELCMSQLKENPDDWRLYKSLIQATTALASVSNREEVVSTTTDLVLDLVHQETEARRRGPFLARLQLIVTLLEHDLVVRAELGTSALGEPLDLLKEFFTRFGQKPSCASDMRPYLCLLGEQQQTEFLNFLKDSLEPLDAMDPSLLKMHDMQRDVTGLLLSRCLGSHKKLDTVARTMLTEQYFTKRNKLKGIEENAKSSELPCSDRFLMMSVQLQFDQYLEQGDQEFLRRAATLLEVGVSESPANFHMKYSLAKIYGLLGAGIPVQESVSSLDIKYVQKDSLGYLMCDQLSPFGLFQELMSWLTEVRHFFTSSEKEIMESLVQGYKVGSFAQIPGIVDYMDRSLSSFHRAYAQISLPYFLTTVEPQNTTSLAQLLQAAQLNSPSNDPFDWTKLRDNRDFSCLPLFNPGEASIQSEAERKRSFNENVDMLKLRQYLLRIVAWFLDSEDAQENGECWTLLASLLTQSHAHFYHCRSDYAVPYQYSLQGPTGSQFHLFWEGGYFPALFALGTAAYRLVSDGSTPREEKKNGSSSRDPEQSPERINAPTSPEDYQGLMRRMFSNHQLALAEKQDGRIKTSDEFPFMQLVHVSLLLQTVGLSLLLSNLAWKKAQAASTKEAAVAKKNKKKTAKATLETPQMKTFQDLVQILCNAPATIQRLLEDLATIEETKITSLSLSNGSSPHHSALEMLLNSAEYAKVQKRLSESYKKSIEEMLSVVETQKALATNLAKQLKL